MLNLSGIQQFLKHYEDEIEKLTKISERNSIENYESIKISQEICKVAKNTFFTECDAYILGSRVMRISEKNAEVFVFLDVGQDKFFANRKRREDVKLLQKLRNSLLRDRKWTVQALKMGLPSLSLIFNPLNQRCTISIANGFSVQISELIGHFFSLQREGVKLYHFLHLWLKMNKIYFKEFTLVLLVVFFLQLQNFMPSAERAQRNVQQDYIEGIPVSFDPCRALDSYGIKKLHYFFSCVPGFFYYFAHFDYESYVISPYLGYPVLKQEYHFELDYANSPMCLIAMLNQYTNHGHYIKAEDLRSFQSVCRHSYQYLLQNGFNKRH